MDPKDAGPIDAESADDAFADLILEAAFAGDPSEESWPELDQDEARAIASIDLRALCGGAAQGKAAKPAAEPKTRVAPDPLVVGPITLRCVYCHDALVQDEAIHCASCLAQHHRACFESHGRCSILHCPGESFVKAERPRPRRRSGRRFIALGLVLGAGLAGASVAALRARGPELLEEAPPAVMGARDYTVASRPPRAEELIREDPSAPPAKPEPVKDGTAGSAKVTESVVWASGRWLARHQSPDGRWDSDGWRANCPLGGCSGPGSERGDPRFDVGLTGLATLAFLGNGHTHRFGVFKKNVARALRWLRSQQAADGSIGFRDLERGAIIDREMYNQAFATAALCEAFAVSRDFKLKEPAQRALDFCLRAQNPGAGWRYGINTGRSDSSVTACMVLALKAGKTAGLKLRPGALQGARRWFMTMTTRDGQVAYERAGEGPFFPPEHRERFDASPSMTAAAMISRIFAGEPSSSLANRKGAAILGRHKPSWTEGPSGERRVNFYYWYFGTYAMFQVGGRQWKAWNRAMQKSLLPHMRQGGCEDGSWDPAGQWCGVGGRVYATAINTLTLEIYYRYERADKGK